MNEADDPRGTAAPIALDLERARTAIRELPTLQRAFVHLHRYERLALRDIAQVLSLSPAKTRKLAFKVYRQLGKVGGGSGDGSVAGGPGVCPAGQPFLARAAGLVSLAPDDPEVVAARAHAAGCTACASGMATAAHTLALIDAAFPVEELEHGGLDRVRDAIVAEMGQSPPNRNPS
jgi:hypothetical protein